MSILSWLFGLRPRYEVSGYRSMYSALVTRLTRTGVRVGGTAGYPRVEIHSIREGERLDKEGALRQISFTVESISNSSLTEAVMMNEDNLRLLTETELTLDGWTVLDMTPVQLQDMMETSDTNKILYRILQEMTAYLLKVKPEPEPQPDPEPEPETSEGNDNN